MKKALRQHVSPPHNGPRGGNKQEHIHCYPPHACQYLPSHICCFLVGSKQFGLYQSAVILFVATIISVVLPGQHPRSHSFSENNSTRSSCFQTFCWLARS